MPGEKYGQEISLVWPEGNDDGEIYIKGHLPEAQARQIAARSEAMEDMAWPPRSDDGSDETIEPMIERLARNARYEMGYARWSQEAHDWDERMSVLRFYREPGRGRFPVTRLTVYPRPPCYLSREYLGIHQCRRCGRRWRGLPQSSLRGPADCDQLQGDEAGPFTEILEELPSARPCAHISEIGAHDE